MEIAGETVAQIPDKEGCQIVREDEFPTTRWHTNQFFVE